LPRVARLMALAIRFEELLRAGTVKDFADLSRLGRVTRACKQRCLFEEVISKPKQAITLPCVPEPGARSLDFACLERSLLR
jgi:hypothetical protein